ncbi:hypothetical protein EV199_0026 [Pseudobacter ginsenosidimutans]|uniref:Reprolysin-like metallo-peptidase family M12B n=2 Tax=Pseudobacter ginsenosidimutans TaxID=661488 RepID=A0A4Q7MZ71_9BACT|nr:hypothetical protein EV199_0026 [Pseudobacter ginsenosidimutans]
MKQQLTFLLLIISPLIAVTQDLTDEMKEWSGNALFQRHSVSSSKTGKSDVLYRIEISFKNGIGTATATYSIENQDNSYGSSYSESGSVTATAQTEFSVTITDDKKYYSVYLFVPSCSGKLKVTRDGETTYRDFGMDEALFQLESKEMGDNPDLLIGNETDRNKSGSGYTEEIYQWAFVRNPVPVDLIIESPGYENWLPEPGMDENTKGNHIDVGLKLVNPEGKPLNVKAKYFEAKLMKTSQEPGVTINYPLDATAPGKHDMRLLNEDHQPASGDGQTLTVNTSDGETGSFAIGSYDGGGYTILEVTAFLQDGSQVTGHYLKKDGPTSIPYPKRDAGRLIAKSWLEKNENPKENDDKEVTAGNNRNGDGLTAYEEYRGMISEGKFVRLDPVKKEVAIRVKQEDLEKFRGGFKLFASATKVIPLICLTTEMAENRIFNKNKTTGKAGDQYGLFIEEKDMGADLGKVLPATPFKTTKQTTNVYINIKEIRRIYEGTLSRNELTSLPYTLQEDIDNTVAHELGHGIGIPHHGSSGKGVIYTKAENPSLDIRFILENGEPSPKIPELDQNLLGGPHNDASGDLNCIMAYTGKYQWAFTKENGSIIYRQLPFMPVGKTLCTSAAGTRVNANKQYFEDAEDGYGNCVSRIKVKCY